MLDAVLRDAELVGDDGERLLFDLALDQRLPVQRRQHLQGLPHDGRVLGPDHRVARVDLDRVLGGDAVQVDERRPAGLGAVAVDAQVRDDAPAVRHGLLFGLELGEREEHP